MWKVMMMYRKKLLMDMISDMIRESIDGSRMIVLITRGIGMRV